MGKILMTLAVIAALAFAVVGCEKKAPAEKGMEKGAPAGTTMGGTVSETAKTAGEQLGEAKDAAVQAAQDALDKLQQKWQDLTASAAPTTDEGKTDLQKTKDAMAQAMADAKAKLVEAKNAGADAWQNDVKPAFDAALEKAQKLYDEAALKFAKKPEQPEKPQEPEQPQQ